jgi:hypothetical protein
MAYTDKDFHSQEIVPDYWAKLTTFNNGTFELAVVRPLSLTHHNHHEPYKGKFGAVYYPPERKEYNEEERAKSNLARSVRRSRQRVRHLIKSLEANHMLTFTYRENMQDADKLKADWAKFIRMMSARYPSWAYVCIRETQERGALHLHVAVKGRQDLKYMRKCWYIAIGGTVSDSGENTKGAVNIRAPNKRWGSGGKSWRVNKLAGYLTKYLGKEMEGLEEHHSKRYWNSKSIDAPVVQKFWLGATNFKDAIVETHDFVYNRGASDLSIWASDDWKNILISGGGLCPF